MKRAGGILFASSLNQTLRSRLTSASSFLLGDSRRLQNNRVYRLLKTRVSVCNLQLGKTESRRATIFESMVFQWASLTECTPNPTPRGLTFGKVVGASTLPHCCDQFCRFQRCLPASYEGDPRVGWQKVRNHSGSLDPYQIRTSSIPHDLNTQPVLPPI